MMADVTLAQDLLMMHARERADGLALVQPADDAVFKLTWKQVATEARQMASVLRARGMQPGDRIAIFSKNCAYWLIADYAIILMGGVSVPIYPNANQKTVNHVLEHSGAKLLFLGKRDVEDVDVSALPSIGLKWCATCADDSWEDAVAGSEPTDDIHRPDPDDLMTILYTSGSTGVPKGAMHSYRTFFNAGRGLVALFGTSANDRLLSYLPMAHCTERAYVESSMLIAGGTTYFVDSIDTFRDDLVRARPTMFGSVPRLWKQFQLGIFQQVEQSRLDRLLSIPILGPLVAGRIRKKMGLDKSRWFASGTAPIAPTLLRWWQRLGVDIAEGWGMTETLAYGTAMAPDGTVRIGSVSKPCGNVEMKVEDGEILVRTPTMMQGYYRNPELTAEAMTDDGYLKTGDRGRIDEDGYVYITGRSKELFKTAKGKYVAPVPIESLLGTNPLIEQCCVTGSGLPQPRALIQMAESGVSACDMAYGRLADTMKIVNGQLESHERLDQLIVISKPWTPENGMLTATMKLKRSAIESHYDSVIGNDIDEPVVAESDCRMRDLPDP